MRIGIAGTGFIARGLARSLGSLVSSVLTHRPVESVAGMPFSLLTNSLTEFIDHSDIVIECSGTVAEAVGTCTAAMNSGRKIVTMNAEFQTTCGSWFARRCFITEAEGDQPGCLAVFDREVRTMGFTPCIYGNIKGYLNHTPSIADMLHWSDINDFRLDKTVSFTDGTKLQIEQVLVANGLHAGIMCQGMTGCSDIDNLILDYRASGVYVPVSDYVVNQSMPAGVFIVAKHEDRQLMKNVKMGVGPYYTLIRPFHLCHLEVIKTILRIDDDRETPFNNSPNPRYMVAAVAKHDMKPGHVIGKGAGGFDVRGIACEYVSPRHMNRNFRMPITLLDGATVTYDIKEGDILEPRHINLAPKMEQAFSLFMECFE